MKRIVIFVKSLLLLSILLFGLSACDSNPKHTHNYNNDKLECSCGDIKSGVVAYIGTSYEDATARFTTLQDAANYVKKQNNKGIEQITVYGYGSEVIECDGLIVDGCNNPGINFDLSGNTVKFTNTSGITVSNSNASIAINNVDTSSGEALKINVESGSLDVEASVKCDVSLSDNSAISFTGDGNVEIENFSSDSESEITLQTESVTIKDETVAQKVNEVKTEDSTSETKVEGGHNHSYNNETMQCSCGEIDNNVIAYIGTSYKDATARFSSLSDAANYVKNHPSSSQVTVYGRSDLDIESGALSIEDSNVEFDLSSNDVSFTQGNGITVTGSTAVFNAKSVSAESTLPIKLTSSTLSFDPNSTVTCDFTLKSTSTAKITSGDITVNSFSGETGCSICFTTSETVKVNGDSVYNSMKNYISNDSTSKIEVVGHEHSYDNDKLECYCGVIKEGVIAYIGSSYEDATARFLTLQKAADYVKNHPSSSQTTVYGYGSNAIESGALAIENSNVKFNLTSNDVTFTQGNGITTTGSTAVFNAKSVSAESTLPIKLTSSTLSFDPNSTVTCDFTLKSASTAKITSGDITVNSFSATSGCSICFTTSKTVKVNGDTVYNSMKNYISNDSTSNIEVVGHEHSYDNDKLECWCGEISSDVIAYIGSSYEDATARFLTLQKAADYVKNHPSSSQTTVYGYGSDAIESGALSIEDSNVEFDLSSNDVSFTQGNGITVTGSTAVFNAKSVSAESTLPIKLTSSTLSFDPNSTVTCDFTLKSASTAKITSGDITVNSFSATSGCSICFTTSKTVKVNGDTVYNSMKNYISNDSTSNIEVVGHEHSYDNDKLECYCGVIKEGVIAYIGSSYEDATARFLTLQKAADYVKNLSSSSQITVNGYGSDAIESGSISIEDSNIKFDLSSNNVTFTQDSGITVTGSTVVFNAENISASLTLEDKSTYEIQSGNVTVNSFVSDEDSVLCLKTSGTVKAKDAATAKAMRSVLSDSSTSEITIDGHTHSFVKKYDEQQTVYWNECTSCGYCTEPQPVTTKWVSMFYLDMANLDSLTDLEEIIEYNKYPENVTIYIITGGGYCGYSDYSAYYDPYYKSGFGRKRSYLYPNLVEALEHGGDTSHKLSFADSNNTNQYQYWKYYLDDSGNNSFVSLNHTPSKLMSDGWVMKDFINYVYSLEGDVGTRYLLHMWNHGGGNFVGMMQDMTGSSWPVMTMKDMDDSVSATTFVKDGHSFDIALFDMCLMQQIENMNILRDYTKCMIGSENSTYASHCGYLYYYINNNPDADYKDIATFFVEKTDEKQEQEYDYEERTWSAVDLSDSSKLDALNKVFDAFIKSIIDSGSYKTFEKALDDAEYDNGENSYDIYNVARLCGYSSLSALNNAISDVIIVNKCGSEASNSAGLAFYFNTEIASYIEKYGTEEYDDYIARAKVFYPNLVTLFEHYNNS